jgi:hypothetical protein
MQLEQTVEVVTFARSLREFFSSGSTPPRLEQQQAGENVLYMLLDENGNLLEAIGTSNWFWQQPIWTSVFSRMPTDAVIAESSGAVFVLAKIPLRGIHALACK